MRVRALLTVFVGACLAAIPAFAQQRTVTGRVTSEQGTPIAGVQIGVRGTTTGTTTSNDGNYSIRVNDGAVLLFRLIGYSPVDRPVGTATTINVQLAAVATNLNAMVVTALGETAQLRSIGTAQQTVDGAAIAQTQRQNFVNALQGRVAGVEVTSTSGVPGASSSITIRGVSSISSSNQPLMIVDGLPLDNKTLNTGVLASDAPGSLTAFSNRGVDFTNRAADLNPDDIESLVVLKGPEASALYGIDAANGAIVIKTKRGRPGQSGFEYSSNFRIDATNFRPEIQQKYGISGVGGSTFQYFGAPYADTVRFYDNIDGFFRSAMTQRHALSFTGGSADYAIKYRFALGNDRQQGVVPNSNLAKLNLTGATNAQIKPWLNVDLSMAYTNVDNNQVFKGDGGPLLGLLVWPSTDNAKDFLTPGGTRRRITSLGQGNEVDNPFFNVNKNRNFSRQNRLVSNLGLLVTRWEWADLKTNIGVDGYTTEQLILRSPESAPTGFTNNGILDIDDNIVRNVSAQTIVTFKSRKLLKDLRVSGSVGHGLQDNKSVDNAAKGTDFLDPQFVSMNNTNPAQRISRTTTSQRRLVSAFGRVAFDWRNYLYLNVTGRNDWTSTIPVVRNSFFYPSVSGSFIATDAVPSLTSIFTSAKFRAAWAQVGKDARPYAYRPSLESKTTNAGGYGYGFTGPNLGLKPEFVKSREFGTELSFLDDRMGLDVTYFRKRTEDQIVNDIRGSYGTGFILFNLNGAQTENKGWEVTARGTVVQNDDLSWDVQANWSMYRGKVLSLPNALPESYVSDTWLYGNVRNGVTPGLSTRSLTGLFYLRDTAAVSGHKGELLIDPTTGLPLRSTAFIDGGYDREPEWLLGITNTFRRGPWSLDFLVDIRKGGDIFNATEHYLTVRGLATSTLDRERPRVIKGILRDGKEFTSTPTVNTIVVVPAVQTNYYTTMSEELFIEKDINWLRLRDVTLRYTFADGFLRARNASVWVTGNDLFLKTNYSGLDPIVNGNSAAVGGSGGMGIDYGNFPMPRGFSFGIRMGF
jgi:TonB-linked SusC/RagA family outer membrane protein